VLAVEVVERNGGDEELGAVGVLAGVGHGEETWLVMLVDKVLIRELFAVDGFAAGSVSFGKVTALQHEIVDHTVEVGALVSESMFSGAESSKVLNSPWDIIVEFKFDAAPVFISTIGWLPNDIEISLDDHFV